MSTRNPVMLHFHDKSYFFEIEAACAPKGLKKNIRF